jgi:hypothetical protein
MPLHNSSVSSAIPTATGALALLNGASVQSAINATSSGLTYTLPATVNTNASLTIPAGVSVKPASGGTIIYGSLPVMSSALLSSDPNYSVVPSAVRSQVKVINLTTNGLASLFSGFETSMHGGNNTCTISIPRLFCDDLPMTFARYPSGPYTGASAVYGVSTANNGSTTFTDSGLTTFAFNSI